MQQTGQKRTGMAVSFVRHGWHAVGRADWEWPADAWLKDAGRPECAPVGNDRVRPEWCAGQRRPREGGKHSCGVESVEKCVWRCRRLERLGGRLTKRSWG